MPSPESSRPTASVGVGQPKPRARAPVWGRLVRSSPANGTSCRQIGRKATGAAPGIRPDWSVFYDLRTQMDRTEDRQLISRLQAGDESAVQELAERYTPRIFQLAMRHMKNREDAEEVTQDVLVKVYRKVGEFRGDSALSSWIYRITFNTAMSRLRNGRLARAAEKERDRLESPSNAEERARVSRQLIDWSHMPDEDLLRLQLRQAVAAAIADLPEIYREPVVLRDIQG